MNLKCKLRISYPCLWASWGDEVQCLILVKDPHKNKETQDNQGCVSAIKEEGLPHTAPS